MFAKKSATTPKLGLVRQIDFSFSCSNIVFGEKLQAAESPDLMERQASNASSKVVTFFPCASGSFAGMPQGFGFPESLCFTATACGFGFAPTGGS